MTDLQKALREAVALKLPGFSSFSAAAYDDGRSFEHARLSPILSALEGCVEALEDVRDKSVAGANFNRTAFTAIADDALETLRKALE